MAGISIIICTCNRAGDLRRTLASFAQVSVPERTITELLVVDNSSTDDTADVVKSCRLPDIPVRYIHEPRRGKGYAYNTGMAEARGEVFLFTDDDVRPPENWIEGMCGPILRGEADAVAGGVRLAPHLIQDWMDASCRSMLASTELVDPQNLSAMIGANMAFSRKVLEKVPAFDPELGPGALGFFDEEFFSWQLRGAGFRLAGALQVIVEHHPDPSRLTRHHFLETQRKYGRSRAYIEHHWSHRQIRAVRLRILLRRAKLLWRRLAARSEVERTHCPAYGELNDTNVIAFYQQFLIERKRPRNYDMKGLSRIR